MSVFSEKDYKREATCVSKSNHNGGFSKHMWLLGGIGGYPPGFTVQMPQQKQW